MTVTGPKIAAFPTALLCAILLSSCAGQSGSLTPGSGTPGEAQGIRGELTFEGRPLKGAYVYAYRTYSKNLLGPADFASNPSGDDGSYTLPLVEGQYYLVARKRASGENTGPIAMGDFYTVNPGNPVTVRPGSYGTVNLDLRKMTDPMFMQATSREETGTGIRGTILDEQGQPVPWVFAMAYQDRDMKRIPDFTSVMTSSDGKFVIYLPSGGTYWLAARKNFRERPVSGEPYGLYAGSADHSVKVPDGRFVENITITVQGYYKGIQD